MATILVVDDDAASREVARLALTKVGHAVVLASDLDAARRELRDGRVELVVSDLWLEGETGIDLLTEMQSRPGAPPLILVTARGTVETAAIAARIGAFDYLAKPFDLAALLERVRAALSPAAISVPSAEVSFPESLLVGAHPSMVALYRAIARVAPLKIPILILGETGTGKELVARSLHQFGSTPEGPLVAVNCGAIPEGLLESELFGHAKGAFTDARRDHRGALSRANGGTIFLDEIGEVSAAFQVKLLRFLEDGLVIPLGSESGETVQVRAIAATNRDLPSLAGRGAFRADLYYRLAGYEIRVPPLRERRSDIPLLVEHFRRRAETDAGLVSSGPASREVLELFGSYPWPGNVRQLDLAVRRILIDGRTLADLPLACRVLDGFAVGSPPSVTQHEGSDEESRSLEEAERRHVLSVLEAAGGNRSETARILRIERKTLRRKLERYGLDLAPSSEEESS